MEKKTIGGLIAALRKANGMTQKELAERLNVSDKSVSRWERDEGVPDLTLIPVIAEIFGITCDELLRGECKPHASLDAENSDSKSRNDSSCSVLSAKGEKECKRILESRWNLYRILCLVNNGITLFGFLITSLFNFSMVAWIGARIAFFIGTFFYLGSIIFQAIIIFIAFSAVSGSGLEPDEVQYFKYRVIKYAEFNIGLIVVCFSLSLPFAVFSINNVMKLVFGRGYFNYGLIAGGLAALLYTFVCFILNAYLIRKGICGLKEEKSKKYWHNHRLLRKIMIRFLCTILFTVLLQNICTAFGSPYHLAKGTKFQDYSSFTKFMEQKESIAYQYHDEAYQEENEITYIKNLNISRDTRKKLFETSLHDADWNIVCTYMDNNYEVCAIRYNEKKGTILPITVITYEDFYRAAVQIDVVKNIFKGIYALEIILFLIYYCRKRVK